MMDYTPLSSLLKCTSSIVSVSILGCLFILAFIFTIFQARVGESLWQPLEEDMIPSLSAMKTNWLESQPKVLPKKYKESNVCIAGGMKVILHSS